MKIFIRRLLGCAAGAILLAGCGQPPELALQRLAPDAPAAVGLPPAPIGGAPTPLLQRTPFGLYATAPSHETLELLSRAPLSPDGLYRAVMHDQGLWITRVDGAWLWQVPLPQTEPAGPAQTPPPAQQQQPGTPPASANQPPAPPAPPKPTKYLGPLDWTPRNTLLLRDDTGTWAEIDPVRAKVVLLPAALQGKQWVTYSPDATQVLYYTQGPKGMQLWVARADGTAPSLLGENVTGAWGPDGKPVVTRAQIQTTAVAGPPEPGAERRPGLHTQ